MQIIQMSYEMQFLICLWFTGACLSVKFWTLTVRNFLKRREITILTQLFFMILAVVESMLVKKKNLTWFPIPSWEYCNYFITFIQVWESVSHKVSFVFHLNSTFVLSIIRWSVKKSMVFIRVTLSPITVKSNPSRKGSVVIRHFIIHQSATYS